MSWIERLLAGELGPTALILGTFAPAILLASYFFGGLAIYVVRAWSIGAYHDREIEQRDGSALLGMPLRRYFAWVIRPLWQITLATGLPANALTTLSALLALGSGVAFASGRFAVGGWLYVFSGILDYLDGRLARARAESSARGAALDSMLDRYSDAVVLIGLAWFYRESWVVAAVLLALVGSLLTSYFRAKGESLGLNTTVGTMQRAERIFALGATTTFAPIVAALTEAHNPRPMYWLAVGGLVFLAVSTQVTAARRFLHVLRELDERPDRTILHAGRGGLPRSTISAFVATAVDFAAVVAVVTVASIAPWKATLLGAILGAVTNFYVNRVWAFQRNTGTAPAQARRYVLISTTSALLNTGGVALIFTLPGLHYSLAWVIVRVAVFVSWNYPLQRDYVFVDTAKSGGRHA